MCIYILQYIYNVYIYIINILYVGFYEATFFGSLSTVPGISLGTLAALASQEPPWKAEEWKSPEICNEKDEVFAEVSKDSIFGRLDSMKFEGFFFA